MKEKIQTPNANPYTFELHLDNILKQIFSFKSKSTSLDDLERISILIKEKIKKIQIEFRVFPKKHENQLEMTLKDQKILSQIEAKHKKHLKKVENNMEDLFEKKEMLDSVGLKFEKEFYYKLKLSIERLIHKENAVNIKFFGKIYGISSDYFILYGRLKSYPKAKYSKSPHHEPEGLEGLNYFTFWVSNSILEDWFQLPEVTTQQMKESFLIKHIFSGSLSSKIKAFSYFSGTESHFLKCQVLRIMHSCFVVPDGYLKTVSIDDAEEKFGMNLTDKLTQIDEDFKLTSTNEELLSTDKWVHEYAFIYQNGKVIDLEAEEIIGRLRPISQDSPFPNSNSQISNTDQPERPIWYLKEVGDKMQYTIEAGSITYSSVMIKNLRWQGACCVSRKGMFTNVYIGNGNREGGVLFSPVQIGEIEKEPVGEGEFPEPYPDKEPVVVEVNTDMEGDMDGDGNMNMNDENNEDEDM